MWIIGLTGAIGAGKSTIAKYFHYLGVPVYSADKDVHFLLKTDEDVQTKIKVLWPEVFIKEKIDRLKLGECVLFSPPHLGALEEILYPKLAERQKKFLKKNQMRGAPFVVLDVPLLFEVGLDQYCDCVVLASAPLFLRKKRVLGRKGMTLKKFLAFESQQLGDLQRKKGTNFLILCGREKGSILKKIQCILDNLSKRPPSRWNGIWPTHFKRSAHAPRSRFRYGNNRIRA